MMTKNLAVCAVFLLCVLLNCHIAAFMLRIQPSKHASAMGVVDKNKIMFYDSMKKDRRQFVPSNGNKVSFYSCGPTLYNYAHIGNLRTFIVYDIVKRWLKYCGFDVDHVCNLTDVDDKIIDILRRNRSESLQSLTTRYGNYFFEDLEALNIKKANHYPKVTDHITRIQHMIQKLLNTGHAYQDKYSSVYFDTTSIDDYGKFARADTVTSQSHVDAQVKKNQNDFALWKSLTPKDDMPHISWEFDGKRGRPGWHIECSAMCQAHFGATVDIHAGGSDLMFPHHENEIAQSECYNNGKKFVRYWIHTGFMNINRQKMSKSQGNSIILQDIVHNTYDPRAFRLSLLKHHYRSILNFDASMMRDSALNIRYIDSLMMKMTTALKNYHIDPITFKPILMNNTTTRHRISIMSRVIAKSIATKNNVTISSELEKYIIRLSSADSIVNNNTNSIMKTTNNDPQLSITTKNSDKVESSVSSSMDIITLIKNTNDQVNSLVELFENAMYDDMKTSMCIPYLFRLLQLSHIATNITNDYDRKHFELSVYPRILSAVYKMDQVLGLLYIPKLPPRYKLHTNMKIEKIGNLTSSNDANKHISSQINSSNNNNNKNNKVPSPSLQIASLLQILQTTRKVDIQNPKELLKIRNEYRTLKKYQDADLVRYAIQDLGYEIIDQKGTSSLVPR